MPDKSSIEPFADLRGDDSAAVLAEVMAHLGAGAPIDRPRPGGVEQFVGVIRTKPCSTPATSDYTDARYYVDRAYPTFTSTLTGQVDDVPGLTQCFTATNLAELFSQTHLLAGGTLVQVLALFTRQSPPKKVYVFCSPTAQSAIVEITGNASGGGKYNGRLVGGASSALSSSNLGLPEGLTVAGSDNALVINSEEDGQSGHRLKSNTYLTGIAVGPSGDSPPRTIVLVRGGIGETASPITLGSTAEGSETADTAMWSRASDAKPLNIYVVTRTVYNEAGDKTLYQFVRQLSFDARGLLLSAGAETRVTVDVTEACP